MYSFIGSYGVNLDILETTVHGATPPRRQQRRRRCVVFVLEEYICVTVQNCKCCFLFLSERRTVVMKTGRHS